MTGDELDRAIDFLLKAEARCEARIEQVNQNLQQFGERLEETRKIVDEQGQTLTHFIQAVARRSEQQDEDDRKRDETIRMIKGTNRRIAKAIAMLAEADIAHAAAQSQTDERLNSLINTVERYVSGRP